MLSTIALLIAKSFYALQSLFYCENSLLLSYLCLDMAVSDAESRVGDNRKESMEDEKLSHPRVKWIKKVYIMKPAEDSFYHDMLKQLLDTYYPELEATLEYHCIEFSYPRLPTHWVTQLKVKAIDLETGVRGVRTIHANRTSRSTVRRSMDDAAFNGIVHYCGPHYEYIKKGGLKYYPRYVHEEKRWTITPVEEPSPVLQATVALCEELVVNGISLKDELQELKMVNEKLCTRMELLEAQNAQLKLQVENNKPQDNFGPTL